MNEEIQFWNELAEEYAEIQSESQVTIAKDVATFLFEKKILPTNTFVDVAGGWGRYVEEVIPFIQTYLLVDFSKEMLRIAAREHSFSQLDLLEMTQQAFFEQTQNEQYDVVFTAMNPALDSKEALNELLRITRKTACILRMIKEQDELFSPYEENRDILMSQYKEWLGVPFEVQRFQYFTEEVITKSFFKDYFEIDVSETELEKMVAKHFETDERLNRTEIVFELLIITKERK